MELAQCPAGAATAGISDWDLSFGNPTIVSGKLVATNGGVQREYNGRGKGCATTYDEGLGAVNGANVITGPAHFVAEVQAGNAGINLLGSRLPLTGAVTPAACGFYFVYVPFASAVFGP